MPSLSTSRWSLKPSKKLLASKNANAGITVEKHVVSEEYVKERVAKGKGVIKEVV